MPLTAGRCGSGPARSVLWAAYLEAEGIGLAVLTLGPCGHIQGSQAPGSLSNPCTCFSFLLL